MGRVESCLRMDILEEVWELTGQAQTAFGQVAQWRRNVVTDLGRTKLTRGKAMKKTPAIEAMPLYTHLDRIQKGLSALGIGPDDVIEPAQLFPLDQWHYDGTAAVQRAAAQLGLLPGSHVLDVGAGLGGPARFLAHTTGCQVTALELQPQLHQIGR